MDGGAAVQVIRARLLEREKELLQLQSLKLDLEDKLNDALKRTRSAESTARRLTDELSAAKWNDGPSKASIAMRHAQTQTTQSEPQTNGGSDSLNAQLVVDIQELKLQSQLWKTTAQLVLQSYRERLVFLAEEQAAFDRVHYLHAHAMWQWYQALDLRRQAAERSLGAVEKLSEVDESRRLEQFRELATLRERLVLLERDKALADRRSLAQDDATNALEEKVRSLTRDNKELDFERGVLLERVDKLSGLVLDHASVRDGELRTEIMSHSQLRAELSRMSQELAICKAEKSELKERLRHALRTVRSPVSAAAAQRAGKGASSPKQQQISSPSTTAFPQTPRRGLSLRRTLEVRQPQLFTDATADLFLTSPRTAGKGNRSPRSATRPFR